jgi:hypothetical protein
MQVKFEKNSFAMTRLIWILSLCLLPVLQVHSQEKPLLRPSETGTNYVVYGQVQDYITRQPLSDVRSQILTKDSVLLYECTTKYGSGIKDMKLPFVLLVPAAGDYILRFSKDGYEETAIAWHVSKLRKSESVMAHPPVLLKRKPKETKLNAAVVKAPR